MRTRRALGSCTALGALAASLAGTPAAAQLDLAAAVRQALEANLDLAAERRTLEANREDIGLARSNLLPQIDVGARVQHLEDDRTDDNRGAATQKSMTLAAELTQVLYDENDWASFGIQKHVYDGQRASLESFRLGTVKDAAGAFLELDRTIALLGVQERNRELTDTNLETARARFAAGWSSQREQLRWESQLASNDTNIASLRAQVLAKRFALNRVRNQLAEVEVTLVPAKIGTYGFVYASEPILAAIATPEGDRKLRDLLVRTGLPRSPELAQLDAAIAAEERQLTSTERAFWVPSVTVGAKIDHLAADDGGSATGGDFNETEWTVGAALRFPLLEGGGKVYALRQSRENLSSLRIQRRATAQLLDQGIRAAFALASGSYAKLGFASRQEEVAQRNYELVNESYVLGVASILALLDAQTQLLTAEQGVTNARYDFLEAVIAAEREMAFFPFLEPAPEVTQLLETLARELPTPSSPRPQP